MKRMIKKSVSILLALLILISVLQGCTPKNNETESVEQSSETAATTDAATIDEKTEASDTLSLRSDETVKSFDKLSDPRLLGYMESAVYAEVLDHIDSTKYVVENVEAVYVSKEYLEESAYNSKSNVFFGYTLDELDQQFQGKKYIFTLGDDGKTTVKEFSPYDDTYDKILLNVAIGTGVILVCVVLTVATEGAGAPAAAAIFAASAKSGAIAALSSAVIGGTAAGIMTGIETQDFDESLKAAALAGSESYKWGAITGAITGGAGEAAALHGATTSGLTMNEVAQIQRESKYPLDVIKQFKSMEEFNVYYNEAKLTTGMVNGKTALLPKDTLNSKEFMNFKSQEADGTEITNLQKMLKGKAPIDPATSKAYQLHHVGQKADGTLAVLNEAQHQGNSKILNTIGKESEIDRNAFNKIREDFWKDVGRSLQKGIL